MHAIAVNVENSRLWKADKYDCSNWSSGNLSPRNAREDNIFWEHIMVAEAVPCGCQNAETDKSEDTCAILKGGTPQAVAQPGRTRVIRD